VREIGAFEAARGCHWFEQLDLHGSRRFIVTLRSHRRMIGRPPSMTDIELLAAIVRGDRDIAASLVSEDAEAFCRRATEHGVLPLVAERLAHRQDVPAPLRALLRTRGTGALVLDLARVTELKRLLRALAQGGVVPLLLKGAHLAYSHYPRPYLRPKPDTDLLVPPHSRDGVRRIVLDLGYKPWCAITGELVVAQATFDRRWGGRLVHTVDVHWKIFNALPFADILTYDELAGRAVAVPSLEASARGLCSVDALVLAAVHRIAHHFDADHLIWLYDIDLIARGLTHEEWREFAALARARKVAAVCRRSLQRAVDRFGTNVPAWIWTDLPSGDAAEGEPTARYLARRTHLGVVLDDLRTLPRWHDRWLLMREHAFPPAAYMRGVYASSSAAPLPLLYVRRLLRGGRKWLKKQV
jgi:Uncharacterised nucleotidyltransferase